MVDHSGATALARRYPLTLKGEEIGGFDLLVSCSGSKGGYDALYIEHRHEGDELALPKVVQSVSLRAAGQEAALKVVSSEQRDDELVTLATGKIPASLVDGFGADGKHSMYGGDPGREGADRDPHRQYRRGAEPAAACRRLQRSRAAAARGCEPQ